MNFLPFVVAHLRVLVPACLALFALFVLRWRRWQSVSPRDGWIVLTLSGTVREAVAPPRRPWERLIRRQRVHSVWALRREARRLANDPHVEGVLIRLGSLTCGWATAEGLRAVILELRASGKKVVTYLPHGGMTRELFVAAASDEIYTSPQGTIAPMGVASGLTFYKSLLARAGVEAESFARREFKSAADSFTRDAISEPNRMQLSALLDALHGALVQALAEGRKVDDAKARTWVDQAMYRAREATEQGLIDGVAYDDELPVRLKTGRKKLVPWERYFGVRRAGPGWWKRFGRRRFVGVVEVRGAIVSAPGASLGRVADADSIVAALRAARANGRIGAVVLYVDTPGGSALASDLIAREVERLREKKPVVAYFSNVAASGGYYVAAMAHEIVAQPVSITGSIGVIALRFVFERTLEKLGLHHEVIRRGAHADLMSPYRHWTGDERALFEHEIDGSYGDFVAIVARGRGRTTEEIEPLARGRVYSGRDAKAVGLVDRLGGLDVAVASAIERGKLPMGTELVMVQPRGAVDPPEPPAAVAAIAARIGLGTDVLNLAMSGSRERLYAFEDRLGDLVGE